MPDSEAVGDILRVQVPLRKLIWWLLESNRPRLGQEAASVPRGWKLVNKVIIYGGS